MKKRNPITEGMLTKFVDNIFTNIKMIIYDLSKLYYMFCRLLMVNGFYRAMLSIGYTLKSFIPGTKKKEKEFPEVR